NASTNSDFSTSSSLAENVTKRNDSSLSSFFSKSFKLISFMPTAALLPQALKTNRNDNNIKLTNPICLIFSHQLTYVHFFQYNNKDLWKKKLNFLVKLLPLCFKQEFLFFFYKNETLTNSCLIRIPPPHIKFWIFPIPTDQIQFLCPSSLASMQHNNFFDNFP